MFGNHQKNIFLDDVMIFAESEIMGGGVCAVCWSVVTQLENETDTGTV